ncbi:MAG: UvrD-helicase domain-containing protein, partial [Patescibacteria group bacterium]
MPLLKNLNEKQKEAVLATDGPLLILAGAGSGKTLVLTSKIAHLIRNHNLHPSNILAVTFTNKAAQEMKERVYKLLGLPSYDDCSVRLAHGLPSYDDYSSGALNIGTFHSTCLNIIRENTELCGLKKRFVIYDDKDQTVLLKSIMKEMGIDEEQFKPETFSYQISKLKNKLIGAERFAEDAPNDFTQRMLAHVFLKYEEKLKENNAVDFDDMITRSVALFKKHSERLTYYQDKFKYILIDEYQDTNHAQYQFTHLLARAHQNICAVGDNDQAIYGWRQADITNILNFEKDYPNAKVILLEENYRSTQNILSAANSVIKKNKSRREKNLFTQGEIGDKIKIILADTEKKEAEYVTKKITELARTGRYAATDFAVLYRTNAQSRSLEEAFMKV